MKMGSPLHENNSNQSRNGYASPEYSKKVQLREFQKKYITQLGVSANKKKDRSLTPSQIAKKRINSKKLNFSPSPDPKNGKKKRKIVKARSNLLKNKLGVSSGSPKIRKETSKNRSTSKQKKKSQSNLESKLSNMKNVMKYSLKSVGGPKNLSKMKSFSPPVRASKTNRGFNNSIYKRNSESVSTHNGYPGSPSAMNADYLLDVDKYNGKFMEQDGMKISYSCINHQDIRAEFFVIDDDRVKRVTNQAPNFLRGTCSKCAVRLAHLGFKCEEIEIDEEKKHREIALKNFLKASDQVKEKISYGNELLEDYSMKLQDHYNEEFEEFMDFEKFVDQIIEMLSRNKEKIKRMLQEESERAFKKLTEFRENLHGGIEKIESLQVDIKNNFVEIIANMQMEQLQGILADYHKEIQGLEMLANSALENKFAVVKFRRVDVNEIRSAGETMNEWFKIIQEKVRPKRFSMFKTEDISITHSEINTTSRERHIRPKSMNLGITHNESHNDTFNEHSKQDDAKSTSKSNVYASFGDKDIFESAIGRDHSYQSSINMQESTDGLSKPTHMRKNSTHKYISILDKISESQNEKNNFYIGLVGSGEQDIPTANEPLFVISPSDNDFAEKQTPELGQKEATPDYLRQQFEMMKAQHQQSSLPVPSPNHVESIQSGLEGNSLHNMRRESSQNKDMEELFKYYGNQEQEESANYKSNGCQKILFDEMGDQNG